MVAILCLRPSVYFKQNRFWTKLNDLGNLIYGPWCVGDDSVKSYSLQIEKELQQKIFSSSVSTIGFLILP